MSATTNNNNNVNKNTKAVASSKKREYVHPFDWLFGDFPLVQQGARWDLEQSGSDSFIPRINVSEDKSAITIDCELAGVPKDAIDVQLHDDVLTISGHHEEKKEEKEKKWHRVERRYGSFSRSIQLPKGTQQDAIKASSKDGILTVTVAKPQEPVKKTSKINIE